MAILLMAAHLALLLLLALVLAAEGRHVRVAVAGDARTAGKTPPAPVMAAIDAQFALLKPDYLAWRDSAYVELQQLHGQLTAKQARGKNMACSQQIFEEALWGVNYTCNAGWTASRVADLAVSLLDDDQAWAAEQQQKGGFWGPCYKTWFNRVAMLIDSVGQLQSKQAPPRFPITFMRNLTDAEQLRSYYTDVGTTDVLYAWRNGAKGDLCDVDLTQSTFATPPPINRREELGAVTGTMHQLVWKSYLVDWVNSFDVGFKITPDFVAAYTDFFLDDMQNRASGMWGERFVNTTRQEDAPARIGTLPPCAPPALICPPDMSITYHTVSYRKGHVPFRQPHAADAAREQALPLPVRLADERGQPEQPQLVRPRQDAALCRGDGGPGCHRARALGRRMRRDGRLCRLLARLHQRNERLLPHERL